MIGRIILFVVVMLLVWFLGHWYVSKNPKLAAHRQQWSMLFLAIGIIAGLAVNGRLHWIIAAAAAAVPVLMRIAALAIRFAPLIQQLLGMKRRAAAAQGPSANQQSTVTTRFLKISLDHATGDMDGVILEGTLSGQSLSALGLEQLLDLLREYQNLDADSAQLLSAYMDRHHSSDWREHFGHQHHNNEVNSHSNSGMSESEAYAILGLTEGASQTEIIQRHRQLMQKVHPDHGGSDYLAARINLAKQTLVS